MIGTVREMEREILQRNRELSALNSVAETLALCPDLERSLDTVLTKVLEVMGMEAGAVYLMDDSGNLRMTVHYGLSRHFARCTSVLGPGEGLTGAAARYGRVMVVENIDDAELSPGRRRLIQGDGIVVFVGVPLRAREEVVGALSLATRVRRVLGSHDLEVLSAIGHQIGVAVENARLHRQALELEKERVRMLEERCNLISRTQGEERKRIARELHDGVAQRLAMLVVDAEVIRVAVDSTDVSGGLARMRDGLRETLAAIRGVLFDLRTGAIGHRGLLDVLDSELLPRYRRHAGIAVEMEVDDWPGDLPEEVAFNIYRTIQESLSNACRHAHASTVKVRLCGGPTWLTITVEDDGIGFTLSEVRESQSFGLTGNQERAALLGGRLVVDSARGAGTRVELVLPRPTQVGRRGGVALDRQ